MSFCIGHKFPIIAVCFIFGLGSKITGFFTCEVKLSINGQKAFNTVQYFFSVISDHAWLYHEEDEMGLSTYLLHEPNYVEVSCEIIDASKAAKVTVYCCGVHEFKEEEEVKKTELMLTSSSPNNTRVCCKADDYLECTQFSSKTHDNQCHYDNNLGIGCCSFPKNLRLQEISDEQWKQLSASINPEMLESDGCMAQENGKTTAIMLVDEMHENKFMPSLHLQLYDDETWDPMLLECQLKCMNENQLMPNDCHTRENEGTGCEESENIVLADQDSHLKGPPLLEYETRKDELAVIPMEHNKSQFDLTLREDNMEAFYATLYAETFALHL